ncbi:MAG: hypothetical protein STSR0009_28270 [Methanoregula sp.]
MISRSENDLELDLRQSTSARLYRIVAHVKALQAFRDTLAADEGAGTGNPWVKNISGLFTKK